MAFGLPSDKIWNVFPGVNDSTDAADDPLFRVMPFVCLKLVNGESLQLKIALLEPVKTISTPVVFELELKSRIPSFIILPPTIN